MKPSKLQFENQPRLTLWGHRSQPWQTMLGVVSLCVMMAFLIQLSGKIWQTRQATQDLNQQAQQLLAKSGPRAMPKPGNTDAASATQELSKEQRQQVNRVIHQLNTPWQDPVNRELVVLCCGMGREILTRQQQEGWGSEVVDRPCGLSFPR